MFPSVKARSSSSLKARGNPQFCIPKSTWQFTSGAKLSTVSGARFQHHLSLPRLRACTLSRALAEV